MKLPIIATLTTLLLSALSTRGNDMDIPEGWATCKSVYSAGDYRLTGGADGSLIVLKSNGKDMRNIVAEAINSHDVIVFDGKGGDFEMSSSIEFTSLIGKTLIGTNGARFNTSYKVPKEVHEMLDEMDARSIKDGVGGTLSNGIYVEEPGEMTIRQALIDHYGDPKEPYRHAGVFSFYQCSNIIIRNLEFVGPGALDVGGFDLLTLIGSDHVWVDHCRFTDGLDGNFDIVGNSDFVTVSDCHFRYTDQSYNHALSNLTAGSEITDGSPQKNNISWIRCFWDEGCRGRMPFVSFGIQHVLNCYWDCTKGTCVDARTYAKVLIESSFFTSKISNPLAVRDNTVTHEWRNNILQNRTPPTSTGTVSVPYKYTAINVQAVPSRLKNPATGAGPTLTVPYSRALSATPSIIDFGKVYASNTVESRFNIAAIGNDAPSSFTLTAPDGMLLSLDPDGNYSSSVYVEADDEHIIQADIYVRACFNDAGNVESSIGVSADDCTFNIPIKADVVGLEGERMNATLSWPLDRGVSSQSTATVNLKDAFSDTSFSMGEKIYIKSELRSDNAPTLSLFNPTEAIGKTVDEECSISFDMTPALGYIFVPKVIKLNAARVGTDMCYIDIVGIRDSGTAQKLLTAFQPARSSNSPSYSEIELPINNIGAGNSLRITVYLYNMSANKQLALGNVVIEGDVYASQSAIEPIPAEENTNSIEYYDIQGKRVDRPQNGRPYIVVNSGSNISKIMVHQ